MAMEGLVAAHTVTAPTQDRHVLRERRMARLSALGPKALKTKARGASRVPAPGIHQVPNER